MGPRALVQHAQARRIALALILGIVVLATRYRWNQLTAVHVAYVDYDTQIFAQIAGRPPGLDLLFAPKPLIVPLVYRVAGNDQAAVTLFQANLSFASWMVLAASLAIQLRRRWTRVIAGFFGVTFLLAPARVGFTASLLSESINDSLMALVVAGVFWLVHLRGRPRVVVAVVTGMLGLTWMLTRDTNAFVAITAAGIAMIVWRGWRHRWGRVASALTLATAGIVLWSTGVAHAPLPYQHDWYGRFTPRGVYPMIDNVTARAVSVLRDELPPELRLYADQPINVEWLVRAGPEHRPVQDWLVDHGSSTYMRWLVQHPLDRVLELVAARWTALSGPTSRYMPGGWTPHGSLVRRLTLNRTLLLVLLFVAPLLLRKPRVDARLGIVLCMIASGVVGVAASYYGDAAEVSRHCYGAGQQIVLGLFLALVVWLDRVVLPGRRGRPHRLHLDTVANGEATTADTPGA
jgi:hypothetical protein